MPNTYVFASFPWGGATGCCAAKAIAEATKNAEGCCAATHACATQQPVFQAPPRRGSVMTEAIAQKWLLVNTKVPGAKARCVTTDGIVEERRHGLFRLD